MPHFIRLLFLSLLALMPLDTEGSSSLLTGAPEGIDVIRKQEETHAGYSDFIMVGTMALIDENGNASERVFDYRQLEAIPNRGGRLLIKIIKPAELQGTGILSVAQPDGKDDQWLHLPSLRQTKRIAGTGRQGRFIGSEFTYEDLLPKRVDLFTYTTLGIELCADTQCFIVEARPKDVAESSYSKTVTWIRRDNFQTHEAHFYNKRGELEKKAAFSDFRQLKGRFWKPHHITMKNIINGRETRLIADSLNVQTGLKEKDFTRRVLER